MMIIGELEFKAGHQCCRKGCVMTLTTYIGGGQWICWLHALAARLIK
jgi:hypothetical protein